jgi:hypothetical protein
MKTWLPVKRTVVILRAASQFCFVASLISTFDLSRYMGASLTMIDRHYGHLARDGLDHAINLLDNYSRPEEADVHGVDVARTLNQPTVATAANQRRM